MGDAKRPSTSSLRRFISSRPYVTIAEIRRRFGLDAAEAVTRVALNGTSGFVGLPEREAQKLEELSLRNEIGLEFSAEVNAPVVVGVYPIRIARFVVDHGRQVSAGDLGSPWREPAEARTVPGAPLAEPPSAPAQRGDARQPAASATGQRPAGPPPARRSRRSSRRSRRR